MTFSTFTFGIGPDQQTLQPSIAVLPTGDFVAFWSVGGTSTAGRFEIHAEVFDATGKPKSSEIILAQSATDMFLDPSATVLADGSIAVAWQHWVPVATDPSTGNSTYKQNVDVTTYVFNGSTLTATTSTKTVYAASYNGTSASYNFSQPDIEATKDGGYILSAQKSGSDQAVFTTKFPSPGATSGVQSILQDPNKDAILYSDSTGLDGGGFVVAAVVKDTVNGSFKQNSVQVSITDAAGGTKAFVSTYPETSNADAANTLGPVSVAALAGGGFALSYQTTYIGWDGKTYTDILVQIYDANGNFLKAVDTPGSQDSIVTRTIDGGFAVAWVAVEPEPYTFRTVQNVHYAVYDKDFHNVNGGLVGNGSQIVDTIKDPNQNPVDLSFRMLPDGRLILEWRDQADNQTFTGRVSAAIIDERTEAVNVTGTVQDDEYFGTSFNDTINGGIGGHDKLHGGDGIDTLSYAGQTNSLVIDLNASLTGDGDTIDGFEYAIGGSGGDKLIGTVSDNSLDGGAGEDNLDGRDGNDTLQGGDGIDVLQGGIGNDILAGGSGSDQMAGGKDDDIYYVNDAGDVVIENVGEGNDIVYVWTDTYTLTGGAEVETIAAGPYAAQYHITGNEFANTVVGGAQDDILEGAGGDDSIVGGDGNDILIGGPGADTLVGGTGNADMAAYWDVTDGVGITISLADPTVNTGEAAGDTYSGIENLAGTNYADVLIGDDGNNILYGVGGDDTLQGGLGADVLDGGAGNNWASYSMATSAVQANLNDASQNSGDAAAGDTYVNILNLQGSDFGDVLTGDDNNNTLDGGKGDDRLIGNLGSDTLVGGEGNDTLDGGNATLSGGSDSPNMLQGGAGDDTYYIRNSGDVIVEDADPLIGGAHDIAYVYTDSYHLADNVGLETLQVGAEVVSGVGLTGNNLDNTLIGGVAGDTLIGGDGGDSLDGGKGDDSLVGGNGSDTLIGGSGNDTLDGGSDMPNTLQGGDGDDIYIVRNIGDVIVEDFSSTGLHNDRVIVQINTYTLGAGVETPTMEVGSEVVGGAHLTGNELSTTIFGGNSGDTLDGADGDDYLWGRDGDDSLLGGLGSDTLSGDNGNDTLDGGLGSPNKLQGGADDDTYFIRNVGDVIVEGISEGSHDKAVIFIGSYTLDDNTYVETVQVGETVTTGVKLTGNTLDNTLIGGIGNDVLNGAEGNDSLQGGDGNDRLFGGLGSDTLKGGDGDDILVGGTNASSTLEGGSGNDTYYIRTSGDVVVEDSDPALGGDHDVAYIYSSSFASQADPVKSLNDYKGWLLSHGIEQVIVDSPDHIPDPSDGGAPPTLTVTGSTVFEASDKASSATSQAPDVVSPFAGIHIADDDANGNLTLTVSFNAADGALGNVAPANGVLVGDNQATTGTHTYTFSGSQAALEAFIHNVTFNPTDQPSGASNFTTSFSFTLSDGLNTPIFNDAVSVHTTVGGGGGGTEPSVINLSDNSIREYPFADTFIGEFSTDLSGDYIYKLVLRDQAGNETLVDTDGTFKIVGNQLFNDTRVGIDYEQKQNYDITIRIMKAGDTGANPWHLDSAFSIAVNDVFGENVVGTDFSERISGNIGNDIIKGMGGNDTIGGGVGKDNLTGGAGNDYFLFDTRPNAANKDVITDFTVGADQIQLKASIFGLGALRGDLTDARFAIGPEATLATQRIIYDNTGATANLYWDPDGSGTTYQKIEICSFITIKPNLSINDFDIIA